MHGYTRLKIVSKTNVNNEINARVKIRLFPRTSSLAEALWCSAYLENSWVKFPVCAKLHQEWVDLFNTFHGHCIMHVLFDSVNVFIIILL